MSIRARYIALSLALALPVCGISVLHAQSANNLQQRMSSDEFKAAGLEKLSPQELQNLDSWLSRHGKTSVKVVDTSGKPVFYTDDSTRKKFASNIVGHFSGWEGVTDIKLANGQVWKASGSDLPSCMSRDNPRVTVKPSMMGSWLMYVDGCNDNAHVQRTH